MRKVIFCFPVGLPTPSLLHYITPYKHPLAANVYKNNNRQINNNTTEAKDLPKSSVLPNTMRLYIAIYHGTVP